MLSYNKKYNFLKLNEKIERLNTKNISTCSI